MTKRTKSTRKPSRTSPKNAFERTSERAKAAIAAVTTGHRAPWPQKRRLIDAMVRALDELATAAASAHVAGARGVR